MIQLTPTFWLWLGIAGVAGTFLRFLLSGWMQHVADQRWASVFPFGTLVVNLLGCLVIGFIAPHLFERSRVSPEMRTVILIGFLGAFTTWSTFGFETVRMLNEGAFRRAAVYVLLTNLGCLSAVWLGFRLTAR